MEEGMFILPFAGGTMEQPNIFYYEKNNLRPDPDHPDWGFHDWTIHSTNDPNRFFVECRGCGRKLDFRLSKDEPHYYENQYILDITMKNGKIKILSEIFNPFNVFRALEIDMPELF